MARRKAALRPSLPFLALNLLCLVELICMLIISNKLEDDTFTLKIEKRIFTPVSDETFDRTQKSLTQFHTTILNSSRPLIVHVSKEYGTSSMGGMGSLVTAFTKSLSQDPNDDIVVIMPYYKFMKHNPGQYFDHYLPRLMDVDISFNVSTPLVSLAKSVFSQSSSSSKQKQYLNYTVRPQVHFIRHQNLIVILIGPANERPFNWAFASDDITRIYQGKNIPQEWQDLYFQSAVSRLIYWLGSHDLDSHIVFNNYRRAYSQLAVHLHGAQTGPALLFFRDAEESIGRRLLNVKFIYTLHDYSYEQTYSLSLDNIRVFSPGTLDSLPSTRNGRVPTHIFTSPFPQLIDGEIGMEAVCPYFCVNSRFYPSSANIFSADYVTFVSATMTRDIVTGRADFPFKELVVDALIHKSKKARLFGITNGLSFDVMSPFSNPLLIKHDLVISIDAEKGLMGSIGEKKLQAKDFLIKSSLLKPKHKEQPIFLFVGRFEYNKGIEDCLTILPVMKQLGSTLIIMGHSNEFPDHILSHAAHKYPNNLVVIEGDELQQQFGPIIRLAADFAFVPSRTESFGLAAAEALLFGATVISTGVGGLREFLEKSYFTRNREIHGNAYIYSIGNHHQLLMTVETAFNDYQELLKRDKMENRLVYLINTALRLGWEKPTGLYRTLYNCLFQICSE